MGSGMSKIFGTGNNKPHILIACMPKSGSTLLTEMIASLPKMQKVYLMRVCDRREQELALGELKRWRHESYVAQHHVKCSGSTVALIGRFNLKPIVLVRNLFDVVYSLYDHLHNESVVSPVGYFEDYMREWPQEKLLAMITHLAIPWYVNFYVSWFRYSDKLMITYDQLLSNRLDVLDQIARFAGIELNNNELCRASAEAEIRFTRKNIAICGRGQHLPIALQEQILRYSSYYEDIDFLPVLGSP